MKIYFQILLKGRTVLVLLLGTVGLAVISKGEQYCRQCINARHLTECRNSVICGSNERCFTEEVVTSTGLVYNSGCLAADACTNKLTVGKRQAHSDRLVTCMECCLGGNRNETNYDCNAMLCGLPGTVTKGPGAPIRCYKCDHAYSIDECNEITTCLSSEICMSETHRLSTTNANVVTEFSLGCKRKDICVEGTKRILQIYNQIGKRYQTGCTACCGWDFCNSAVCGTLLQKINELNTFGHLDINSLTYKP